MYTPVGHDGGAAGGRVVLPPPSSGVEGTANWAAKLIFPMENSIFCAQQNFSY